MHKKLTGTDLHAPSNNLVENQTGVTIAAIRAVKFVGAGVYPRIELTNNSSDVVRGITQAEITNGAIGYITSLGLMYNVNTAAYSVGTKLYAGASGVLTNMASGLPVAYVLKSNATTGILYVANTGVTSDDIAATSFPTQAQIRLMWSIAYPFAYAEYSYNGTGDIVDYNIWSDNTKTIHVFNKHFSYLPNGDLTQIFTTFYLTGDTLTRDITYDLNGQMINTQDS
jgi:hypothetical protein